MENKIFCYKRNKGDLIISTHLSSFCHKNEFSPTKRSVTKITAQQGKCFLLVCITRHEERFSFSRGSLWGEW